MAPLPLRLFHDLQRLRERPQRHSEPAQPGHAGRQQLERGAVRRAGAHVGPGQRPGARRTGPRHRRRPHLRPPCAHRGEDADPDARPRPRSSPWTRPSRTSTPSPGTASPWRTTPPPPSRTRSPLPFKEACAMNAIVVVDQNWAIGRDNDLLFSLPTDMKRFRALTLGGTVILGRRTPGLLSRRAAPAQAAEHRHHPLPGLFPGGSGDRAPVWRPCGRPLAGTPPDQLWVIGGGSIYAALLSQCRTGLRDPGGRRRRRARTPSFPIWTSCPAGL